MKAFVINLDREAARLAFQSRQLGALGIAWDRLAATTPETLSPSPADRYWTRWERPLSAPEKAAHASHRRAWERIAAGATPALVLEDDAVLMPRTPALLARLDAARWLDHVSLETRGRRKLLGAAHPDLPLRRLWQDYSGAAAYVLWPEGARKLIARADRAAGIADAVICAAYDLSSWQAAPALALQADRCAAEGLAPPIPVETSIGRVDATIYEGLTPAGYRRYRLRRIAHQARMALRRAAHPLARREKVRFAPG
ncbi:MAG: glycosyltransferase family 25 protein [Paracoccaceae bacterium]